MDQHNTSEVLLIPIPITCNCIKTLAHTKPLTLGQHPREILVQLTWKQLAKVHPETKVVVMYTQCLK